MSDAFFGEIRLVAFTFPPRGWALCNGQILAIQQNQALFSLLGTTYGGDGRTTFALPDFRHRAPMSVGQGPGLTPRTLGEIGGANTVTLGPNEIPPHTHPAGATAATAASGDPNGQLLAAAPTSSYGTPNGQPTVPFGAPLGLTGGGQPHENRQPFLALNFVICLGGIFPSRG